MKYILDLLLVLLSVIGILACVFFIWYLFSVVFPMLGQVAQW